MEILALLLVIVMEASYIAYLEYNFKLERQELVKAILAKDLTDLTTNAIIDREKPEVEVKPQPTLLDEASDEEFNQAINNQLHPSQEENQAVE